MDCPNHRDNHLCSPALTGGGARKALRKGEREKRQITKKLRGRGGKGPVLCRPLPDYAPGQSRLCLPLPAQLGGYAQHVPDGKAAGEAHAPAIAPVGKQNRQAVRRSGLVRAGNQAQEEAAFLGQAPKLGGG